jgi:phosphohistidine phosphatase
MDLYLIRHADAAPTGGAVTRDADRALSSQGRREATGIGKALSRLEDPPALVLTSPFLRAVQTGELICAQFAQQPEIRVAPALAPGLRVPALLEELSSAAAAGPVAAVAHQPDVGNLISWLVSDGTETSLKVVPCGVARLTLDLRTRRPRAVLHWFLIPDLVRCLLAPDGRTLT